MLAIWAFVAMPLAVVGTIFGRHWMGKYEPPCRINSIPRFFYSFYFFFIYFTFFVFFYFFFYLFYFFCFFLFFYLFILLFFNVFVYCLPFCCY
jgi:hypothetical protein